MASSTTRRPIGLIWQGSFFVRHSLALVNRELSLALLERDAIDLGIQGYEPDAFGPEADPRFQALADRVGRTPEGAAITLRHAYPPLFRRPSTARYVLIQPWEYGYLPVDWVRGIEQTVDEVWTPSSFVRQTYIDSGVPPSKVFVVPNGVNTNRFHPKATPRDLPTDRGFRFLFVGGTIQRKGIDRLLDAYTRAFTRTDDVALVIKDFGTNTFYRGQDASALIAAARALPGGPEIVYMTQDLDEADMPGLYAACDCLVHPYRGEGYGLPIAEAMACGKPTVVTAFGAALDFANEGNCYLVPATRTALPERRIGDMETVDQPYWAEPDVDALAAALRRVYEDRAAARAVGARAAADIAERHTWAHAAEIAEGRLRALAEEAARNAAPTRAVVRPSYEERKQQMLADARAGDWEAAVREAEECMAESATDWDVVNALAVSLYRTGHEERSRELLEQGIRRSPNPRDFHHNLAFVCLDTGDALAAVEHASAAFVFSPESAEIRRTLERAREAAALKRKVLLADGQPDSDALSALTAAIRRADDMLRGRTEPAESKSATARLSLVMIARDEEEFLADCLESVRDVVDEIIVVDTGSVDRTPEIAAAYGAKVVRFEWVDDFSAARNEALRHATGDWGLWLDADERLSEGDGPTLRKLIAEAPDTVGGYFINIRNVLDLSGEGDILWHRACRLFRLHAALKFQGRIHEQNVRSIQQAGFDVAPAQIVIEHLGYAAEIARKRNKNERFIRMVQREVEENPDDPFRGFQLFNLGNAFYTAHDYEAAAHWFAQAAEQITAIEDYTPLLFVEWGVALLILGRPLETVEVCARAEQFGLVHPGIEFARGHAALRLRDYIEAEKRFVRAIELGKSNQFVHTGDAGAHTYKALYGLSLALTGRDRFRDAIEPARQAVEMQPNFHDARYLLANLLRRTNDLEGCRDQLTTLLRADPTHALASAELGMVLHDLGKHAEAVRLLRPAAINFPTSWEILVRLGTCCEQLGFHEEAARAYESALRLLPRNTDLRVNLGRVNAALGRREVAIRYFTEAIRLDPGCANAYFNSADLLYSMGLYANAADAVSKGLERQPNHPSGFFVLGNCYYHLRDYAAAAACYRQALAIDPAYAAARGNLDLAESALSESAPAA